MNPPIHICGDGNGFQPLRTVLEIPGRSVRARELPTQEGMSSIAAERRGWRGGKNI